MSLDPGARQRLLELVYDLLPDSEAAELRGRMEADAELARAYTEAQDTARLLSEAARLRVPKIALKRPERTMSTPSEPSPPQAPIKPAGLAGTPRGRGTTWVVGLAATALVAISLWGYWYHHTELAEIAAKHMRVVVTGPSSLQGGVPTQYTIVTTDVTGRATPAQVKLTFRPPDGSEPLVHNQESDQDGRLQVAIPVGKIGRPGQARLEVLAVRQNKLVKYEAVVPVEPARYLTRLALDKPLYRSDGPGETVYYRSLTLSRFGLAADRPMPIHFEILDPSGAVVPGSQLDGATERGVGNGMFRIPAGLAGGEYTLVARSLDGSFPDQKRPFFIRAYRLPRLKKQLEFTRDSYGPGDKVEADFSADRAEGGPAAKARLMIQATVDGRRVFPPADKKESFHVVEASGEGTCRIEFDLPEKIQRGDGQLIVVVDDGGTRETIAKTIPINLGKVEVQFFPEGGDLVAGLENRVYFVGRDPLGEPVHITGTVLDDDATGVAMVETTHEGMGSFSFTPQAGVRYRLKIDTPGDGKNQPKLPKVSSTRKIVLTTGSGVFEAGRPLEFNIRAARPGLPLVVSAFCRGVPVGQRALVTKAKDKSDSESSGANPVVIALDDSVGGVIRLTVYDYRTNPPVPVAERLVYRRMTRGLNVRAAGHGERYSPGQRVEMSLIVTDEKGRPVPAVLGVAVVDDALLNLADDDTSGINTHFLLGSEVENPQDLEDADFYLGSGPEAAVALDLLLGTQGWRRFVEKTLQQIREEDRDEPLTRLVAMGGPVTPPLVFDNLGEIHSHYKDSLAKYEKNRTKTLKTLTTVSVFGALGLLLFVAMLGLWKVVSGFRLWAIGTPAAAAAACCLFVAAILLYPDRRTSSGDVAVAYSPFNVPPPEVTEGDAKPTGGPEEEFGRELPGPEKKAEELGIILADEAGEMPQGEDGKYRQVAAEPALEPKPPGKEWKKDDERGDRLAMKREAGKDMKRPPGDADLWDRDELVGVDGKRLRQRRFIVRQFAHVNKSARQEPRPPGVRKDFTESLYWHPMLIADADGRAQISFDLSDSITTFRVLADAHAGGRIGSGGGNLISRIPFNLEPKLPLEVNAGDRIDLPLAVVNDSNDQLPVELRLEHGELVRVDGPLRRKLELAAEARGREYFALDVVGQKGDCKLTFHGTAGRLKDSVERLLRVVPPGFPKSLSYSGQIDGRQEVVVDLPEHWVPGSLEVTLGAFPSTLADLQKGMESILREPCGCFEQASTSNYPNVLSLQYMQEHDVANPAVTRRAKDLLKKGYAKLTAYECKKKGYEWFGGDPGHEALTAYGLMEFRDMAEVYGVDREMIRRTAQWLMDRRDGKGGFKRNARALDSFGRAPQEITDAYITWALSESGQEGIEAEVKHVVALAEKSEDPYLIALAAAGAIDADKTAEGKKLLERLAKLQAEDGHLVGKKGSITRSGGRSLKVETTALAALAWLKAPAYVKNANKAVEWIVNSRGGSGGFGSTQATILALKALVEHSKANKRTLAAGKLIVKRDKQQIGEHAFGPGQQETIVIDGLEASLKSGRNKLTIELTGENKMPYALDVSFRTRKPQSDDNCPVRLATRLDKKQVASGATVVLQAELVNTSDQDGQPMTLAILGLPAGLEPRADQLEELKKAGTFDYYETRPRQVICYWRSLAPKEKVELKLDLIAEVPGKYVGPASRVYLYYTPEQKQWCDPLEVEITP